MDGDFPGLGAVTFTVASGLCLGCAVVSARGRMAIRRRREALLGLERRRRSPWAVLNQAHGTAAREWAVPTAAGLAAVVLIPGPPGWLAGIVAAFAIRRWQRMPRPELGCWAADVARQLPFAADLLGACLAAGATPGAAADAVGRTLDGPLGEALAHTAAELRLGGDPSQSWSRLRVLPGAQVLARWMERASTTGVPPVTAVCGLATAYRVEAARSAGGRARRAAVLATAPLGLCFLPAFLAVGVVPVVIGLAEAMTHAPRI